MPSTFVYKVRDPGGKVIEGQLEADSAALVVDKLRSMGYTPISVDARSENKFSADLKIPGLSNRVSLKDVAVMSRQFATMIDSGLSILRSLAILADQTENKELGRIIGEVRLDVERGASLSAALVRHPKAFNRLYVAMVRSGETSGTLDSVLIRLADTIEKQVELRRKVKSAMTYPVMVGAVVFTIAMIMLVFIVPQFEDIYHSLDGELPAPTKLLLGISRIVRTLFPVLIVGGIIAFFLFRRWINTQSGRAIWDRFKLRMPIFGGLIRKTALARFARTLASLTRAGVPILESLEIVADTAGNTVVANAVHDTQRAVKGGDSIARPLEQHEVFPPMVVQMMAVGEETGALDEMLEKIAEFYEQEVEATVDALTSLIEPLLIVVMGVMVGGMIVALYLPLFNIIKLIQ
ncbi:MAG TPA: type II secretion system F family protein [Acidimicrobiia bacterium]|nr:type II secretion system F family protein [Acidimicrobiia bacterium]